MAPFVIRPATSNDLDRLTPLVEALRRDMAAMSSVVLTSTAADVRRQTRAFLDGPFHLVLLALEGEKTVGFIRANLHQGNEIIPRPGRRLPWRPALKKWLRRRPPPSGPVTIYLADMFIIPDHRHSGLGRALLEAAEDQLRAGPTHYTYGFVLADNAPIIRLMEKIGYRTESLTMIKQNRVPHPGGGTGKEQSMDQEARKQAIAKELDRRFGGTGTVRFFRSPGRVDLMGSHTDYNQGFILATTIDRDIIIGARPRQDGVLNLYSLNTALEVRTRVESLRFEKDHGWANYPKGVIKEIVDLKIPFTGADLVYDGNIPVGGNLSSSAAIEASTCEMALALAGADLPRWERVHLCRRAENNFMSVPCGIMDQFAVIMGGDRQALRLDCRSLQFEPVSFAFAGSTLVVIDSGLGRQLVAGKYAERVRECQQAVAVLRAARPEINSLRDATAAEIERYQDKLGDAPYRRARHVLSENDRVLRAAEAVKAGDEAGLGRIMEECYQSCKLDYENSTPALDELHDVVAAMPGMLGVRICGAGWGGCLLALVKKDSAAGLEAALQKVGAAAGRKLQVWIVNPTPGAGPLA